MMRGLVQLLDRDDESISDPGYSLHKDRLARIVTERAPQEGDAARQHLVAHHAAHPNLLDELVAGHHFALPGRQRHQDTHDLGLEMNGIAPIRDAAVGGINGPVSEAEA